MRTTRAAASALAWILQLLLAPASLAEPRVRLMFAVPRAEDYLLVMDAIPNGQVTAIGGETFVLVGEFADARQGHALGLALQRRLGLAFELIYDPDHPQADLSWLSVVDSAAEVPLMPSSATPAMPPPLTPPPALAHAPAPAAAQAKEPLVYLVARPGSEQQIQLLAQVLRLPLSPSPAEAIQVGVYRDTPQALQALARRQAELTALGIPVEQQRRIPGQPPSIGR